MEVFELHELPEDHKPSQPRTKLMLDDLRDSIEFGSVEPKISNGKITHIVITQTVKAID